jgi:hypothetical protein
MGLEPKRTNLHEKYGALRKCRKRKCLSCNGFSEQSAPICTKSTTTPFHGVLAPNAKLRSLVVPQGPEVEERATAAVAASECVVQTETNPDRPDRPHRIAWARLLKRVFDIDMQHCPNCGAGELKIIAAILERPVIEKILTHLGLDPQPPPRGRAREARQD